MIRSLWTALMVFLGAALASGQGVETGESKSGAKVTVFTCLERDLCDAIVAECRGTLPAFEFIEYIDDRSVLEAVRALEPSAYPDLLFGVSTVVLSHLADQGMLEPHEPDWGGELPVGLSDRDRRWYGVFGSPIVIIYNRQYFEEDDITAYLPEGWEDLAHSRFKGSLVLANPTPFNTTGYFLSCLIDRAEQETGNQQKGFDLLTEIDRNLGRPFPGRSGIYPDMELTLSRLLSGGDETVSVTTLERYEECIKQELPAGFIPPVEGLFLFPRGIALVKGAADEARRVYDNLTARDLLRRLSGYPSCYPLIFRENLTYSMEIFGRIALDFYQTDHDAVRRNIGQWVGHWQNLIRGSAESKTRLLDDAINTAMTFLIPLVLLIVIFTSRKKLIRPRTSSTQRGPEMNNTP